MAKTKEKVQTTGKKIYTPEEIWALVETNDYFVLACLSKMLDRQTEAERADGTTRDRNGRGFNSRDAQFLTDLAFKARKYRSLSPRQLAAARKSLYKYRRQLAEIANELNG